MIALASGILAAANSVASAQSKRDRASTVATETVPAIAGIIETRWAALSKHPLVGRIYATDRPSSASFKLGTMADAVALLANETANGTIVILGEIHDNGEHHFARSLLAAKHIRPTAKSSGEQAQDDLKPIAWVFEQLRADQQPAIAKYLAAAAASGDNTRADAPDVDSFFNTIKWDEGGWKRADYKPVFAVALQNKLPIYAGDVTRDMIMKAARQGAGAVSPDEMKTLRLDVPLGDRLDDASLIEIEQAHCGMMPKSAFGGMAFAQRYRDAHLADATIKAATAHGAAVLFAGNTHVRTDRGVAWYIGQREPNRKVVSVMLVEVEEGQSDPTLYGPRDPDGKAAADYLIFTPPVDRPDPCEAMRAKMKKPKP